MQRHEQVRHALVEGVLVCVLEFLPDRGLGVLDNLRGETSKAESQTGVTNGLFEALNLFFENCHTRLVGIRVTQPINLVLKNLAKVRRLHIRVDRHVLLRVRAVLDRIEQREGTLLKQTLSGARCVLDNIVLSHCVPFLELFLVPLHLTTT